MTPISLSLEPQLGSNKYMALFPPTFDSIGLQEIVPYSANQEVEFAPYPPLKHHPELISQQNIVTIESNKIIANLSNPNNKKLTQDNNQIISANKKQKLHELKPMDKCGYYAFYFKYILQTLY